METQERKNQERESGFTLIELLIAIVVVGVLTAVAIVGIGGLVDNGKTAACQATMDAAKAAQAVHFANTGKFPQTFTAMTDAKELDVPSGVGETGTALTGKGWTLTLTPGANDTTVSDLSGCPTAPTT
jgi:prepilin-type N-terminal cleavage/methylation domain-containing protein